MHTKKGNVAKLLEEFIGKATSLPSPHFSINASRKEITEKYAREIDPAGEDPELDTLYKTQTLIRPLFGKEGYVAPAIGDHPDFEHLRKTGEIEYHPITTMFIDIQNSTRMGLLYPLDEVFLIKNAFIRAAIEVIVAFDGHVHRIMGDAVMAYFGGKNMTAHQAAINALNCAAFLKAITVHSVCPKLSEKWTDHQFGVRIGLDYGDKDQVLWSSYGYPQTDEVTATSYYVDVASKLQHAAGRNEIMIGDSLKSFVDFPTCLLSTKVVQRDGKDVHLKYVSPNHSDADGNPINYGQFVLNSESYLQFTKVAINEPDLLPPPAYSAKRLGMYVDIFDERKGDVCHGAYAPCSAPLGKKKWLRFRPQIAYIPQLPYKIHCRVENHGDEAKHDRPHDLGNHEQSYDVHTQAEHENFEHWEHTDYRGLHYFTMEIEPRGTTAPKYRGSIGVYVE